MTVKDDYKRACVALAICHQMLNDANDKVDALESKNERLKQGLKDVAANFAEMEHFRNMFYAEKEDAETALLFANREIDRLWSGVNRALMNLRNADPIEAMEALEALHES